MSRHHPDDRDSVSSALQGAHDGASSIFSSAVVLLRHGWNIQMRALVRIGAMNLIRGRGWIFAVIGFVLLAFVMPIGVVFVATAIAASGKDPRPENDYIVRLDEDDSA